MQPQISPSPKEIIKKVTEQLGEACADKFMRQESNRQSFDETVRCVSGLSAVVSPGGGVPCCYGKTDGTAPDNQTCSNWGGTPGKCGRGGGPGLPPLEKRQTLIRKITGGLAQLFADKIDDGGPQSNTLYQSMLQKLAELYEDANQGLPLISCRLPDGNTLNGVSEQQCRIIGGQVE